MMLAPTVLRRLTREVVKLQRSPPDGIAIKASEQDFLDIDGWIQGPAGTPYAGGFFRVNFTFVGTDFPAGPPKCTMRTKIFHPNIHSSGEICVSTLKKDWSPAYGIEHILTVIKCLLISPNPDSALDPEAARLLQEEYEDYASTASIWTRVHASQRPACMPDTGPSVHRPSLSPSTSSAQINVSLSHGATPVDEQSMKKMDVEVAETTANVGGTVDVGLATSQPLARSGSMNVDLHHKASFDRHGRRSSAAPGIGPASVSGGNKQCPSAPTTLLLDTGTAAAAAAATAAAMTAAMTAEMCKFSLDDRTSALRAKMVGNGLPARKRVPVVRRGIKRL